jgi:outer membrane lipoprotein-sorting protein
LPRISRSRVVVPTLLVLGSLHLGAATVDEDAQRSGSESVDRAVTGIEDLMQRLAQSGGVQARFHEIRYVSLLTAPLESEGMLYFAAPDLLARHTTRPGRSSVVVRGSHVVLRDETGSQDLPVGASELAPALIDHLVGLLRGDLEALRARHTIRFGLHGEAWELRLEPKSRVVRSVIDSIRIEGRGSELVRMEVVETNGDRTVTSFSEVQRGLTFTPSEIERLFSVEGREKTP